MSETDETETTEEYVYSSEEDQSDAAIIQGYNVTIAELITQRNELERKHSEMKNKWFHQPPQSGYTTPSGMGIDREDDPTKKEAIQNEYHQLGARITQLSRQIVSVIDERDSIIRLSLMAAGGGRRSQVVPPTRGKPRQRKTPKKSKKAKKSKKCKGTIYTINGQNYCVGEKIMSKKYGIKKNRKHTSKKSKKARKSKKTRKR
jgi:hypothetical protein